MKQQIALCFLTYDNLSQPELWKKFIDPKYNFYIHNKNKFTGEFDQYCIKNRVETKWGDISLVKATLNLFKEAFITKENKYFILLSDKCIPLYNPDELYKKVNNIDTNLITSFNEHRERFDLLTDKNFLNKDQFMKQSQWMLLERKTVQFFIENDYTHIYSDIFAPDEHYFINIINKFNISFINRKITNVNWNERSDLIKYRPNPKTYSLLTNKIIEDILRSDVLFMRKIESECKLPSYFDTFSFNKLNSTNIISKDSIIELEYVAIFLWIIIKNLEFLINNIKKIMLKMIIYEI